MPSWEARVAGSAVDLTRQVVALGTTCSLNLSRGKANLGTSLELKLSGSRAGDARDDDLDDPN